jgi:hypothetical protein
VEGACERDSDDGAAFLVLYEAAAIDEEHIILSFALESPPEYLIQVPKLLVMRLLL